MRFSGLPFLASLAIALLTVPMAASQANAADDEAKPYTVKDGKVDKGTYNGYRRFNGVCDRCHGMGGAGSSFAPNLLDSLHRLSYSDFLTTVAQGRQSTVGGVERVMPSFANAPDVMEYINDIYAYLKARSDGVLGPGRPERIPDDQTQTAEQKK